MKYFLTLGVVLLCCRSYSQKTELGKPFFIAQATYNRINTYSGTVGANGSLGILFKKSFGAAVNAQLISFTGNDHPYVPLSLQLSFTPSTIRPAPYFHFTIGQGLYTQKLSFENGAGSINGGLFLSAGGGIYAAAKKGGGVLITVSYINAGFRYTEINGTKRADSKEGFQIGVGFRI